MSYREFHQSPSKTSVLYVISFHILTFNWREDNLKSSYSAAKKEPQITGQFMTF